LTPNHDKSILELNRDSTDSEYLSKYVPWFEWNQNQ
jgi:hypothetical protein